MAVYQGNDFLTDIAHVENLQSAFDRRAIYVYKWQTYAEMNAQTGMRRADEGFLVPSGETYKYEANVWKLWHKPEATVTPVIGGGISLGNGTVEGTFSAHAGLGYFHARVVFGSTTMVTGDISITLPKPSPTPRLVFGSGGRFTDASTGVRYEARTLLSGDLAIVRPIQTSTAYAQVIAATALIPFIWAVSDQVELTVAWAL